jgi:hypothetical protein
MRDFFFSHASRITHHNKKSTPEALKLTPTLTME